MEAVVPTPAQVFRMATQGGAATTPFADRIGTLAPGRGADLVLMPWRDLASPYLEPGTSVVDALVYRGRAASVETVVIAGEVVLRGGRITGVDKSARLAELAAQLERPRRPEEERRRQLAEAIFPHVQRFYERWLDPGSREPFYRANARR
jgi:cytosine/adenosine deaminase-related metal-dependent hydrolase